MGFEWAFVDGQGAVLAVQVLTNIILERGGAWSAGIRAWVSWAVCASCKAGGGRGGRSLVNLLEETAAALTPSTASARKRSELLLLHH